MPASRKPVDLGSLDQRVGFHLRLAQLAVFKDFIARLGTLGVTPAIYSVLEVLRCNPGITQSRLAGAVRLERSSVVPLIDKLGQRGLVERRASTTDRRHNHLYLTVAGTELMQQADRELLQHEASVCAGLSAAEKRTLLKLLGRFGS